MEKVLSISPQKALMRTVQTMGLFFLDALLRQKVKVAAALLNGP